MAAASKHILALDQGTTSSRAIVFDQRGEIISCAQQEYRQHYPRPGWVEHDPGEIWSSQKAVMDEALAQAGLAAGDVAALGISNQRETTLVWDRRTGEPIHPAIVWQDRRTARRCRELREAGHEALFSRLTGKRLDPYFAGTKLAWILDEVKGARQRAEAGELAFGTVDSWLVWKLSGGRRHLTDVTNACRTLLFDIRQQEWSQPLLDILDIPRALLPEVVASSGELAETEDGIPIAGIAGDQHAALFGQACFERGMAKNTYGTGCFLLLHTGEEAVASENDLLTTIAWKIGDRTEYAIEGSIFMGGATIQWLRDELGIIDSAPQCDELAAEVEDNGGLVLVPAFTGLGAPHWDPNARGLAIGMTRGTNKRHLCRAALESIALQSADLAACMEADSSLELTELRVDGGASASNLLMQIQADLVGREVVRPAVTETTALGAAYLAGLAVGVWSGQDELASLWQEDRRFHPQREHDEVDRMKAAWNGAVDRARDWAHD